MSNDTKQQLLDLIYLTIDEINEEQPASAKLGKVPHTVLYGEGGLLDSMGLVRLVVLFEQKVRTATRQAVSITDERAFSRRRSPFRTIDALTDYVAELLLEP